MMRRGPLADYPLDTVLRTAADEQLTGSITVERDATIGAVYLMRGQISGAIVEGVDTGPIGGGAEPTQASVQRHIESVVALLSGISDGWYHHDPIDAAAIDMGWRVEVGVVLAAADRRRREAEPLLRWAGAPIRLEAPVGSPILGSDAWQVIAAMVPAVNLHDLHAEMGWETRRLAAAIEELEESGLLGGAGTASTEPAPRRPAAATAGTPPVDEPAADRPPGPRAAAWRGEITVEKRPLSRPSWSARTGDERGDPEDRPRTPPTRRYSPAAETVPGHRWAGAAAAASEPVGVPDGSDGAAPPERTEPNSDGAAGGRRSALKRLIDSLRA